MIVARRLHFVAGLTGRRTDEEPPPVLALREMIRENVSLAIPGIALQELLTGVVSESQSEQLKTHLSAFEILLATERHHADAGAMWPSGVVARSTWACSAVDAADRRPSRWPSAANCSPSPRTWRQSPAPPACGYSTIASGHEPFSIEIRRIAAAANGRWRLGGGDVGGDAGRKNGDRRGDESARQQLVALLIGLCGVILCGRQVAIVRHADVLAHRMGEPGGTLL